MCEYAKFDGDIPICTVDDNKLCTLCVLGNADTYKKAREEAQKALDLLTKKVVSDNG